MHGWARGCKWWLYVAVLSAVGGGTVCREARGAAPVLQFEIVLDRTTIRPFGGISGEMVLRNLSGAPVELWTWTNGELFGGVTFWIERDGVRETVDVGCYNCGGTPVKRALDAGGVARSLFYLATTRFTDLSAARAVFEGPGEYSVCASFPWVAPDAASQEWLPATPQVVSVVDGVSGEGLFRAKVGIGERVGVFEGGVGRVVSGAVVPDDPQQFGDYAEEFAVFQAYEFAPLAKELIQHLERDPVFARERVRDDIIGGIGEGGECAAVRWLRAAAMVYDSVYGVNELMSYYNRADCSGIIRDGCLGVEYQDASKRARLVSRILERGGR